MPAQTKSIKGIVDVIFNNPLFLKVKTVSLGIFFRRSFPARMTHGFFSRNKEGKK